MAGYGDLEWAYAEPLAIGIANDPQLRAWILKRTKFANEAENAVVLVEEMQKRRGKSVKTWWRSHYSERCRCAGCSGQETDLLAVFDSEGFRFALHIEIKQPTDIFPAHKDQAAAYGIRADCWVANPPKAIVPHTDADTMLICGSTRLMDYALHLPKFGSVLTFEEIRNSFPMAGIPNPS